jgi:thiamine biosynthesis lipoprotein
VAAGAAIDLGATAKGWIAGRALDAARAAWPALPGAILDLGGDVAVSGSPPEGGPWLVDVEDPSSRNVLGRIALASGGVATSGPSRRRFGPRRSLHHLIDPATLAPSVGGPVAATAVAPDAAAADAHSTALAVTAPSGAASYVGMRAGLGAVLVLADGTTRVLGDIDFTPAAAREVAL